MSQLQEEILRAKEDLDAVYEAGVKQGEQKANNKPYIDTSKITDFSWFYYRASDSWLNTIPQLDTSSGTIFYDMFRECPSLTTIPELNTSNGTNFSYMFYHISKIRIFF